jgi:hypothetical protein
LVLLELRCGCVIMRLGFVGGTLVMVKVCYVLMNARGFFDKVVAEGWWRRYTNITANFGLCARYGYICWMGDEVGSRLVIVM